MKYPKLNANLRRLRDANFDDKITAIMLNMKDNPNFDSPAPSLEELEATVDAFRGAVAEAEGGDKYKKREKNEIRKELEKKMEMLAGYVSSVAAGDKTKLASSGFDLEKDYETKDVVPVQTIKVTGGQVPGEVVVRVKGARGAKVYIYQHTPDPLTEASEWTEIIDTKARRVITGLQPVKKHSFRVGIIGKGGVKIFSHVVTYTVQ